MKKVGLVSVRNYNYGSILQAYALQQELFAAGIDNELIYYKKRNVVKVRRYSQEQPLEDAVERTIRECMEEDVMADFLKRNRAEGINS